MSYKKDHDGWDKYSRKLEDSKNIPFFKEREVWWVSVGVNIGYEEDGKGEEYSRPTLVLKKLGKYTFIGIPLSTSKRIGRLYYHFRFTKEIESAALLGHIRSFDSKRLIKKYGSVNREIFDIIRKAAKDLL